MLALSCLVLTVAASPVSAAEPANVVSAHLADGVARLPATLANGTVVESVFMHLPSRAAQASRPLGVLVVLHGMGDNGPDFAAPFVATADRNGWLLVAPAVVYGDPTQFGVLASEDPALVQWLSSYLEALPGQLGLDLPRRALIVGHSRGAQLAHRFALLHPAQTDAVAVLSAGTYTLPSMRDPRTAAVLGYPFGVADLPQWELGTFDRAQVDGVRFWVGVGANDVAPGDVPRAWDAYEGRTRLQRAQAFAAALDAAGAPASLTVFPNTAHDLTDEMRASACGFLQTVWAAEQTLAASNTGPAAE